MDKDYVINNIFNENGVVFNDLIKSFLESFLDAELNIYEKNDIINNDVISNL